MAAERAVPLPAIGIALIAGDEEFLVAARARAIVEAWCPAEQQALNLEIITGETAGKPAEACRLLHLTVAALNTPSLLGGGKTVWLRDAAFLAEAAMLRVEAVKKALQRLADTIRGPWPAETGLVISAPGLDKRQGLYRACKEKGTVEAYDRPQRPAQADKAGRETLQGLLRKAELRISAGDMQVLLEKAGADMRQLVQEVEKLRLAVGAGGRVERRHIDLLVAPAREAMHWALADAAAERDLPECLRVLEQLFAQQESAVGMLFGLENSFRQLEILRTCLERKWASLVRQGNWRELQWNTDPRAEEALAAFGRQDPRSLHPFRAALLAEKALKFSPGELPRLRAHMMATHEQLVSGSLPDRLQMEMLCMVLARRQAR